MKIPFLSRGIPNTIQNIQQYKLTASGQDKVEKAGGGGIVAGVDMDVLMILHFAGGASTISEVSKELGRSPQFTRNVLETLRGRGYVIIEQVR